MAALLSAEEFNSPAMITGGSVQGSGTIEPQNSEWYFSGNGNALNGAGMVQPSMCNFVETKVSVQTTSNNWIWFKMGNTNPADNGYNNNGCGLGYRGDGHVFAFGTPALEIPTGELVVPQSTWSVGSDLHTKSLVFGIHQVGPTDFDLYMNKIHLKRMYGCTASTTGGYVCWGSYNGAFGGFDYVRCYEGNPYFTAGATLLD